MIILCILGLPLPVYHVIDIFHVDKYTFIFFFTSTLFLMAAQFYTVYKNYIVCIVFNQFLMKDT